METFGWIVAGGIVGALVIGFGLRWWVKRDPWQHKIGGGMRKRNDDE